MEVEMKWEFLEEKASETLSTDATSSCNFSDAFVSIYLQSKWSTLSPISSVGGRHEFTHSLSESVGLDEGAIIHNLWWSCMKEGTHLLLPVLPQSSSDRRSVQQVSTTTFPSLSDRIMHPNFLQSPLFFIEFFYFFYLTKCIDPWSSIGLHPIPFYSASDSDSSSIVCCCGSSPSSHVSIIIIIMVIDVGLIS